MRRIAIGCLRFYQRFLSPLKPPMCRFRPTCSSYAIEAFQKRGFFLGCWFTALRLLRCHPFARGGFDPVPERGLRWISTDARLLDHPPETSRWPRLLRWFLLAVLVGLVLHTCLGS